ncbi:ATPase family gene 2 protein homolog A-like [Achroia grisella]|uniref:ATPase family gene 2 protein homolog A-like n=1 Tax=Achroia grisella TaxID=688607 RepID=UPI0027D2EB66|nr:ATPase family gene 2 protein homolog A-like [Achroia grisella]
MASKQAKKTLWVDCERCGCCITSNDKNKHVELNCSKDQLKCPYIEEKKLHSWLVRGGPLQEGVPRNSVMVHPSAGSLIGAVIGGALELSREGAPTLVKRMWPSKTAAPAAVILPAADLAGAWCSDNKKVTVSVVEGLIPDATHVTIKINNHKVETDICDILRQHFHKHFVNIGTVLVYYYFGKKLEIQIINVTSENLDGSNKIWCVLSENTVWSMEKDVIHKVKKKPIALGGIDDILDEVKTFINISFRKTGLTANFQPTRGLLIHGHSGIGKTAICKYLIENIKCYYIEVNGPSIFSKYFGETEAIMKGLFSKAKENEPSIILVDEIETICPRRSSGSTEQERRITSAFVSLLDSLHEENCRVFVLATTRKPDAIDPMLRRFGRLDKEIEVPIPDRYRRKQILNTLLKSLPNKISSHDIDAIGDLAHGYVAADLVNLCSQASMRCIKRSSEIIEHEDLMAALTVVRPSAMRELLIEIPNVRWSDIGGLGRLKLKLRQAVEWPLKHAGSFKRLGVKPPSGVLLYGPPGCSKTMIAKALATESGLNFLSIRGPELFSKWVGESERAVRDLFTKARQVAPSIIFFDEMDAIGGERGVGEAGVHERVLAQLLTELDGVVPLHSVTVLAATNRPDKMDSALLRPGRLDRLIYVPLPDLQTRLEILELKLSKMSVSKDVSARKLAKMTEGFSGAELNAVCHEAALQALERDIECPAVSMDYFINVLMDFVPRTPESQLSIYTKFAGQRPC